MKNSFEVGQVLEAKVLSIVDSKFITVSIEGTFYQVENQTPLKLTIGASIKLIVDSKMPIRLKLVKQSKDGHTHFHV